MVTMRYFFDLHEDDRVIADEEGFEFNSMDRVQQEAARSLADMARDAAMISAADPNTLKLAIHVRDQRGEPVIKASFSFEVVRSPLQ